jgi:adenine-specific DNA-methyltransferase
MEQIKQDNDLTKSLDIVNENIARLKELFPEVVTEGKIDFKVLQDILGNEIEEGEEYYRFTWAGKAQARREAHKPSTGTLRPVKDESVNWDTTQNLYIEGDNLEVLKLLQKSYAGKVKMIYIDPPYNTGKDFVYKDNYKDNLKNYQQVTGQVDDEGNKLTTNSESDGRYHSNWLNMMYSRILLAKNLLKDDGIIFMSIDDNEVNNLQKIGVEIFGEENFVANIIWQHSIQPKGYSGKFSVHHNYTLCFQKSSTFELNSLERTEEHNKSYSNPDNDPKGLWRSGDVRNALYRPNLIYDIITPSGKIIKPYKNGWRWSKETVKSKIESGEIIFSEDETRIIRKIYLSTLDGRTPETIWFGKDSGTTRDASNELKELFNGTPPFDTPKPTNLIKKLIELNIYSPDDIILDFFAGSSTTADSTMQLNSLNSSSRKFILVQLPEKTDEKSDAYKAGFKTIAEIGKERIRRAAKKIAQENLEKAKDLDLGFKVFKLDNSNIKGWDGNSDNLQENLFDAQDNIKTGRTEEDVLYEILLKYGLDLTLPIEEKLIQGKKVFSVGYGALFICLADGITSKVAEGIGAWKEALKPEVCRVIFKDSGFGDVEKTNSVQTLKRFGINEIKSI